MTQPTDMDDHNAVVALVQMYSGKVEALLKRTVDLEAQLAAVRVPKDTALGDPQAPSDAQNETSVYVEMGRRWSPRDVGLLLETARAWKRWRMSPISSIIAVPLSMTEQALVAVLEQFGVR